MVLSRKELFVIREQEQNDIPKLLSVDRRAMRDL